MGLPIWDPFNNERISQPVNNLSNFHSKRNKANSILYKHEKQKMRVYVLWYYITDQSYELNKIINKDVMWFFIKLVLKNSQKLMTMFVVPLLQDTTSYRKNNNVD